MSQQEFLDYVYGFVDLYKTRWPSLTHARNLQHQRHGDGAQRVNRIRAEITAYPPRSPLNGAEVYEQYAAELVGYRKRNGFHLFVDEYPTNRVSSAEELGLDTTDGEELENRSYLLSETQVLPAVTGLAAEDEEAI